MDQFTKRAIWFFIFAGATGGLIFGWFFQDYHRQSAALENWKYISFTEGELALHTIGDGSHVTIRLPADITKNARVLVRGDVGVLYDRQSLRRFTLDWASKKIQLGNPVPNKNWKVDAWPYFCISPDGAYIAGWRDVKPLKGGLQEATLWVLPTKGELRPLTRHIINAQGTIHWSWDSKHIFVYQPESGDSTVRIDLASGTVNAKYPDAIILTSESDSSILVNRNNEWWLADAGTSLKYLRAVDLAPLETPLQLLSTNTLLTVKMALGGERPSVHRIDLAGKDTRSGLIGTLGPGIVSPLQR